VIQKRESDLREAQTGRYRARDLLSVPGLLSLLRIPLAVVFPFLVGKPLVAVAVLCIAGVTDVLDGWYARRFGQVTSTGCAIDPVTDKLFVVTVAFTLVATGHLSIGAVVLLSTREIGELPLVAWLALNHYARGARAEHPAANVPGKIATGLQFAAVSAALLHVPHRSLWVVATAVAGIYAAYTYWKRSLAIARRGLALASSTR
jgi:CDP-diacylglycerol--glycerol-3-phosphate 3-phosphatidyltransferase/cardiolipin synthase